MQIQRGWVSSLIGVGILLSVSVFTVVTIGEAFNNSLSLHHDEFSGHEQTTDAEKRDISGSNIKLVVPYP